MNKPRLSRRLIPVALCAGLVTFGLADWHSVLSAAELASSGDDTALLNDVMRRVQRDYVSPVKSDKLVQDALKGMLTGLDPHSAYMDEKEFRRLMSEADGEFVGVGLEITQKNEMPVVLSPIDGTPAAQAGVEPGDVIVAINGQRTEGMKLDEVVEQIRGQPQTQVALTLTRNGQPPFDVRITRAVINIVSVKSALQPDKIAYARITNFDEKTQSELAEAIRSMTRQAGGRLNGFVLDLRDDPGGLLNSAVAVTSDFIDGGVVVTTRGRDASETRAYNAGSGGDRIPGVPMVVLINSASASASEIVAGALKDHHRATLMGTRSFGKGSVQAIIPLEGHGALRLTTALYYTPSGQSIQDTGVAPDIVVSVNPDEAVANALVTREADLKGALKNPNGSTNAGPASLSDEMKQDRPIQTALIGTSRDNQLAEAVKFLRKKTATRHSAMER